MGRGNIIKSKKQIQDGIKSGLYLRTEGTQLIQGIGNGSTVTPEDQAQNMWVIMAQKKVITNPNQYKFWEWYTTYEDERYYVLVTEDGGQAIRIEKLEDLFPSGQYPFFTASSDDDLTEFWNPSPLDGVIEPIIAKSITINQFLDNAEAINRPMKAWDVNAIDNPALLNYRPD
jgi:ABC-type glycerol-3-phosphate transport system substrate-binding protein